MADAQRYEILFDDVLRKRPEFLNLGYEMVKNAAQGDRFFFSLYQDGVRGMLARIMAVERNYQTMNQCLQHLTPEEREDPELFFLECEYYAGIILFGMGSSIECFVFAMNAIGFAKSTDDFLDITTPNGLRDISPLNIIGGGPDRIGNPQSGYHEYFPRVQALWNNINNKQHLSAIFDYHNTTKHRSSVALGGGPYQLCLIQNPKEPGNNTGPNPLTLQKLTQNYHDFIDQTLTIALEEASGLY
jgi:hypothetical protein